MSSRATCRLANRGRRRAVRSGVLQNGRASRTRAPGGLRRRAHRYHAIRARALILDTGVRSGWQETHSWDLQACASGGVKHFIATGW